MMNFTLQMFSLVGEAVDPMGLLANHLVAAVVFSLLGVIVLIGSLFLIEKITPFSITNEIEEEHNSAMAMVVSAIIIGIAIIIAAAIHG